MKQLRFLLILLIAGLLVIACSSGSSDDSGTTGGSGDTDTADTDTPADSDDDSDSSSDDSSDSDDEVTSSGDVWLDAYSFNCSSNWTNRDGPLGLAAYSGSGSCSKSFSGTSGTYQLILYAVTEFDGESPYRVSINGTTIKEGTYPLSSSLYCDCPTDDWRSVCPDKQYSIDLGTHTLSSGDTIGFWGDDVYPCGEHGAYTKWYGIKAVKQ